MWFPKSLVCLLLVTFINVTSGYFVPVPRLHPRLARVPGACCQATAKRTPDKSVSWKELKQFYVMAIEALNQALSAKDTVIEGLLEKGKRDLLEMKKIQAVCDMRSLVEVLARESKAAVAALGMPNCKSVTAITAAVTARLAGPDGKLTPHGRKLLAQLREPSVKEIAVGKELNNIYHKLYEPVHHPLLPEAGFYCGGVLPLRAATAMTIMEMQELSKSKEFTTAYCDESFRPRLLLKNGKAVPVENLDGTSVDA
jgi:hypothetical protein